MCRWPLRVTHKKEEEKKRYLIVRTTKACEAELEKDISF